MAAAGWTPQTEETVVAASISMRSSLGSQPLRVYGPAKSLKRRQEDEFLLHLTAT